MPTTHFGFTVLGSGSSGNATVIHGPEGDFLLDAGFNATELRRRMKSRGIDPDQIKAIFLTHAHTDHVAGCRVFTKKTGIPVYMTPALFQDLQNDEKKKQYIPKNPVLTESGTPVPVCGVTVESFAVSHDVDAVAYTFRAAGRKLGYATDLGCFSEAFCEKMSNCDALIMESNHDPKMLWASDRPIGLKRRIAGKYGHLNNAEACDCLRHLLAPCTKRLILAHLSHACNDPELVRSGVQKTLHEMNRQDVVFEIARQDSPLETCRITNGTTIHNQ